MDKVVMVLCGTSQGVRLVKVGQYLMNQVVGIYRLDSREYEGATFADLANALTYIRDHGSERLEGEPLPEKPEEVWAQFEGRGSNLMFPYVCGRCLNSFSRCNLTHCPRCNAKLAAPQPWVPVRAEGTPQ